MGFFTQECFDQIRLTSRFPRCGTCGLYKRCRSPKIPLTGEGRRGILVVGEAPGAEEDRRGLPFVGDSGRMLQKQLKSCDIDLFRDCWITNSVICRPPDNRDPTQVELDSCLPNLLQIMREQKPKIVLTLGRFAISQVVGQFWHTGVGTGFRWLGRRIPSIDCNAWICPTYHPAFIARKMQEDSVESVIWKKHINKMSRLRERPWPSGPPDYKALVRCLHSPRQAAAAVEDFVRQGGPVAFDYESDCLKPDREDARIVSCSVSNGEYAISFPWAGEVIPAMRDLLWSSVPKIAWNMKHEERWTRKIFGRGVRNWLWDGMLATHVVDNRQEVTSLKFQAFVRLGMGSYNTNTSTLLRVESGNDKNKIRQISWDDLLLYGGLDSLFTAKIAEQQMRRMKHAAHGA